MKVIITIDYSPWSRYSGGAQRSSHYLATELANRGHDVVVVNTKPPWEHVDVPVDLSYRHRWATFFDWRSRRNAPLRPLNAFSVARVVREELASAGPEPAIVHANGEEGGRIYRLKRQFNFGLISTPRHPHYPALMSKGRNIRLHERIYLAATEGKYLMQKKAAITADYCVPPSRFAAELTRSALLVDDEKIRVVYNGVPAEFLDWSYDERKGASGPIVFFGRYTKVKGVDILLEAYHRSGLKGQHKLHLIGRGELQDELTNTIDKYRLNNDVQLIDWMNHKDLGAVLSTCAFTVLPSLEENFSLAVLAATCVGAPVISTAVGGTPEIIDHDATGMLITPGSINELAKAMTILASKRSYAEKLGRAGSAKTRLQFTWERATDSFEEIYRASIAHYRNPE